MNAIDHVGIAVPDLEAARRVWDELLGQEAEVEEVPSQQVRAATYPCGIELVAPTAAEADALATAFFVLGVAKARDYCAAHPEIGAVLLPAEEAARPVVLGPVTQDVELAGEAAP